MNPNNNSNGKKTLYEWTKDLFANGVEMFNVQQTYTKNGTTLTRDTTKLKKCSLGLITVSTAREWYDICRLNCDVGVIIEDYDEKLWKPLFDDMLLLARLALTEGLVKERMRC